MLKLLAFKWLLNELLVETEWSSVILIWWSVYIRFIESFPKFSFFKYIYSYDFPCNFNFTGKTVNFQSTDIIMEGLSVSVLVVFLRKVSSCFFFFPYFNKNVKPKCETPFTKLLKRLYLLYISNIRHSKWGGLQKYILLKNK